MAEYIDLDDLTTGHAGTIGDPYSYADYLTYTATMASGIQFYVKGALSTSNAANPSLSFLAKWGIWDKWGDDPWRLEFTSSATPIEMYGYILKNGIIYRTAGPMAVGTTLGSGFHSNMIINTGSYQLGLYGNTGTSDIQFRGCSFKSSVNAISTELPSAVDCTFDIPGFDELKGYTLTTDHCSFTAASPLGTHTNFQYSWPAGVAWPAFDAYVTSFLFTTLGATLGADAVPGIPPYTGYETDMWGNTRSNISGFAFGFPPLSFFAEDNVADGTNVTSFIDQDALVSKIQDSSSDTYFDSINELGKAYVYYTHEDLRQNKRIQHNIDGTNLSGQVVWPSGARDGLWMKTRIRALDKNGAVVNLTRSEIGTEEDATHSAGSMYLNNTSPPVGESAVVAAHHAALLRNNMLGTYTDQPT